MATAQHSSGSLLLKYELGEAIFCGTRGVVYRALERSSGGPRAVKVLPRMRHDMGDLANRNMIGREIRHMHALRGSPHVARLRDVCHDEHSVYLVQDLCSGPRLEDAMRAGDMGERACGRAVRDVLLALRDCHDRGVLFGDVKPQNVVLCGEARAYKLVDFGSSLRIESDGRAYPVMGHETTPLFLAPEGADGIGLGPQSDVWALGVLAYWLIMKAHPFVLFDESAATAAGLLRRIRDAAPRFDEHPASRDAIDFMRAALVKDPRDRPGAADLLEHPFMHRCRWEALGGGK
jgi:calcium-dependent protein kinase